MTIEEALQQTIDIQKQAYEDMKLFAHQAMKISIDLLAAQAPQVPVPVEQQEFEEELDSALKGGELD